jgi:ABC-2 type transport system ATP-binding protein
VTGAEDLTKRHGDALAMDDLRFAVRPGVVTGLPGPNGSGKSTAIPLIMGLDAHPANRGSARCWR